MKRMEQIVNLALLFFIYSFAGWCIEVTLKYFQYHRFINRGFLAGPWLPIYGSGALLITLTVGWLSPYESSYGTTFVIAFIVCGVVEYLASYFMEKRFHARWWDYSQKPMNLNGRVWIGNLVLFGLGGVLIIHAFNPILFDLLGKLGLQTKEIFACVLIAVFAADYAVSHFVLKLVKTGVERSEADNTEEINREIKLLLSDKSIFYRRFADAYPDVIYRTERITARLNAIKAETERLRRQAEQRMDEMGQRLENEKEQLSERLEPSAMIRASLIQDQEKLIQMLYDETSAKPEERELKEKIDAQRERLRKRFPLLKQKENED